MVLTGASPPSAALAAFERARQRLEARDVQLALSLFTEAESKGFDPDECGGGRWMCHMLGGDFARAWDESAVIAARGSPDPNRLWSGQPLRGKDVIVRALHGLGDAIQFARFVPLLRGIVHRLYVEVPRCLVRLFRTIPDIDQVLTWDDPRAEPVHWNEQIEVMELARIFRATPESLPTKPYLFPPAPESNRRVDGGGTMCIHAGLAWASSNWNPARSVRLALLEPLLRVPNCRFFSLQQADRTGDLEQVASELEPEELISADFDVLDTASALLQMDVVITVDTMVAHLAGALGIPVWLMLTEPADWRWMLDREDSPWYPTMRVFRQGKDRDWTPVVERITAAMKNAKSRHTRAARAAFNGAAIRS